MQLSIGTFELRVSRRSAPLAADRRHSTSLLLSPGHVAGPFIGSSSYDNPAQNLAYVRETVAACMHARSEAVSRGKFRLTRRASSGSLEAQAASEGAGAIQRLLDNPNPSIDLSDMLELSQQWLDATGNSLWLKVRDGNDRTVELWPVPALSFYIEKGEDGLPGVYRFPQANARIAARDLIHFRRADLRTAPFLGHAVLSDMIQTATADTAIRLYQARFFENDATPRTILRWPEGTTLTLEQMSEIREAWDTRYAGPANSGRIAILPDGGEMQMLGSTARELDFGRTKKELRDTIREAFKVPQIVLGDVEGVNLSNAETSYTVFLRDVVDFSLAKHARALTRAFSEELGVSQVIEHDSVVPENEERFLARLKELKDVLTTEEKRRLLGFGPRPVTQ
jgi:HK97 family phage portal protein